MREALLPWGRVRVQGPSMAPTLRSGDTVVIRYAAPARPGQVVLARFRSRPELLVVKRAVRPVDGGWWVRSDNPLAGGDSTSHGVADVLGVARWRWRGGRPARLRPLEPRTGGA